MTKIEWTDETDNIIIPEDGGWFCQKVSPACANCYAEQINQNKFFGGNGRPYSGEAPPMILRQDILDGWARQAKPRRHFVSSMTDIFGEWVDTGMIMTFLDAMVAAPRQTFQLLTKRAERMKSEVLYWYGTHGIIGKFPSNIWLGFSAENQEWFNRRWQAFLPHDWDSVLFVSAEPLLGPIQLPDDFLAGGRRRWVICGGESGPKARPMNPAWALSLRDQCGAAGVPFFFKQWGEWAPWDFDAQWDASDNHPVHYPFGPRGDNCTPVHRVGKKLAGRSIECQQWSQFPHPA